MLNPANLPVALPSKAQHDRNQASSSALCAGCDAAVRRAAGIDRPDVLAYYRGLLEQARAYVPNDDCLDLGHQIDQALLVARADEQMRCIFCNGEHLTQRCPVGDESQGLVLEDYGAGHAWLRAEA